MTERPKPVDLDKLDRLYAKATDGTWAVDPENSWVVTIDGMSLVDPADEQGRELRSADDARYIAALHNAYPALSARLRELEAVNAIAIRYAGEAAVSRGVLRSPKEVELRAELEAVKRERDVALKALDRELVGSENLLDALEREDKKP